MKIKRARRLGFLQIRALVALLLFGAAICMAKFSFAPLQVANSEHNRAMSILSGRATCPFKVSAAKNSTNFPT